MDEQTKQDLQAFIGKAKTEELEKIIEIKKQEYEANKTKAKEKID